MVSIWNNQASTVPAKEKEPPQRQNRVWMMWMRPKRSTQSASMLHFLFGESEKHQQDEEPQDNKHTLLWLFKSNPLPLHNTQHCCIFFWYFPSFFFFFGTHASCISVWKECKPSRKMLQEFKLIKSKCYLDVETWYCDNYCKFQLNQVTVSMFYSSFFLASNPLTSYNLQSVAVHRFDFDLLGSLKVNFAKM